LAIWARGLSLTCWAIGGDADYCERAAEICAIRTGAGADHANRFMPTATHQGEIISVAARAATLVRGARAGKSICRHRRTRLNPFGWRPTIRCGRAMKSGRHDGLATQGFHLQHYTSLVALAQIEMYTGDYEVA
jgi:hypothetical protein